MKGMIRMDFIPEVLQVVLGNDYHVFAYFNDGTIRAYDVLPLIQKGGVFKKLSDLNVFHKCLTVLNGTVAWDLNGNHDVTKCIDIDPFDVYNSPVVKDPLEKEHLA